MLTVTFRTITAVLKVYFCCQYTEANNWEYTSAKAYHQLYTKQAFAGGFVRPYKNVKITRINNTDHYLNVVSLLNTCT